MVRSTSLKHNPTLLQVLILLELDEVLPPKNDKSPKG